MTCYHPRLAYYRENPPEGAKKISFTIPSGPCSAIDLPCGKCIGCRLDYSRGWAIRCTHESKMHKANSYITLTYKPSELPPDESLSPRDLSLFLKRLRKTGAKYSFFACGEYGANLKRPHYHACLFGWRPPDLRYIKENRNGDNLYTSELLSDVWGKGYIWIGEVTFKSAAYVARYITKKLNGDMAEGHYNQTDADTGEVTTKVPEFVRMSYKPAIGKRWFDKFGDECYVNDFVIVDGHKMKPPRYYDKLLAARDPAKFDRIRSARVQHATDHTDDNTPERLAVRERVQQAKSKTETRPMEGQ